jgi:hypothetical protein
MLRWRAVTFVSRGTGSDRSVRDVFNANEIRKTDSKYLFKDKMREIAVVDIDRHVETKR